MRKLTIFLQDPAGKRLPGLSVAIHPKATPNRHLATAVTNRNGRADLQFELGPRVRFLTASITDPATKKLVGRETRAVTNLSDHWPIEIDVRRQTTPASPATPPRGPADNAPDHDSKEDDWLQPKTTQEGFAAQIDAAKKMRDAMRAAARGEFKRRRGNKRQGRKIAGRVLGGKPRGHLGAGERFIPASEKPRLREILEKQRGEGLDRLHALKDRLRGIALRDEDVARWGLKEGAEVKGEALDELIDGLTAPQPPLGPVQSVIEECEAEHRRDETMTADGDVPDEEVRSTTSILIDARIDEAAGASAIDRIATVLDAALGITNGRPERADIVESLKAPLPLGPADVDAYYDYQSLRIAWADSWSAVADGRMAGKMAELYETIVDIVEFEPDDDADFSEIDELHDLLEGLEDSVEAAAASYEPIVDKPTPDMISWMPKLAEVWAYLSDADRRYTTLQWELERYVRSRMPEVAAEQILTMTFSGFFDRKLWKIPPYDDFPTGWVPDMKIGGAIKTLVVNGNYFRDRVEGHVDLDEAAAEAAEARKQNENGKDYATHAAARLGRAERLIGELKESLVEPYQFDVFAEGAYNFGVLTTYRQRWRPLNYQAGDLAGTLPLAPSEKRSYTITHKVAGKRTSTEESAFVGERTSETFTKRRAEGSITDTVKRSMKATAEASVTAKYGEFLTLTGKTTLDTTSSRDSERIKKDIRESTAKVVQKYRDENKVSVSVEDSFERSTTESREISNPNNEITVTYLFYELQRRYEVTERFYDLQPVILVAFEMPRPDEITEAWLLKHDWIIERALLDRSFYPALTYLSETFAGDEVAVEVLEQQWKTQLSVVADLRRQGGAHQRMRDLAREAVERSATAAGAVSAGNEIFGDGLGQGLSQKLFNAAEDVADTMAENARTALDWAEQDLNRIEEAAREAVTALERATAAYVEAIERRLNRRVQIDRLILHIKQNIHHYMQAVWAAEHPDQRYLRLYDMEIQWPGDTTVRIAPGLGKKGPPGGIGAFGKPGVFTGNVARLDVPSFAETRMLHQVADIDRLLGFRGNLAVFPLTENNALSTFLAQDYLDSAFGLSDPDEAAEIPTASEAVTIAQCAWRKAGDDEAERQRIAQWLMDALRDAHRVSQEVIIPTGELFIEALPGTHPLLEDFKLKHRAYDAAKAASEARMMQLDLIRRAARLENGDMSDPDVDKFIRIDGPAQPTVDVSEE